MSQENVEVVEAAVNAFSRGGLDAFAEYWTDVRTAMGVGPPAR